MVDLPEAERPVSQTVTPVWLRRELRSLYVTLPGWNVMLVAIVVVKLEHPPRGKGGEGHAIVSMTNQYIKHVTIASSYA